MSTYSGFFNSIGGDRKYNAVHFSKFFDGLIADGVYVNFPEGAAEEDRGFHVSANSEGTGYALKVAPGRCWFNHAWMYNDADLLITLDPLLNSLLSRIDAVVIDVNNADTDIVDDVNVGRLVDIKVVKGNEASRPDKPTLTHTATHNQYALAYVKIDGSSVSVNPANIEDAILSGETPAVEALLEYSSRSKAEMKTYIDNADTALQNQVNDIKTPTFTEAAELANLAGSGEGINTMWGKVKKLFSTILSVLPVNYGGTGSSTHTVNSVLLGNGNSTLKNKATAAGAFYANATNGEPLFGTLPINRGGTGATTAADALNNLGVPSDVASAMSKNVYCSKDPEHLRIDKEHGGTPKKTRATCHCKALNSKVWSTKTWSGLSSFFADHIWTDGDNIYYSYGSNQYVLNKATSTWSTKTWSGRTNLYGAMIWTDGDNIYYSDDELQYVLNKATSTWSTKTWSGLTSFDGGNIWTDGDNIYYSSRSNQYVLNKATSTWSTKTWSGLTAFYGRNGIWTDGDNIYYSNENTQYVLNKATSTWSTKTWSGLTSFDGGNIWTDGDNIYYSDGSKQYVLNKATSTWSTKTWADVTSFYGGSIWTDGDNIYYSNTIGTQYILTDALNI